MRAFNDSQCNAFLNAFGQSIETSTGSTFTGIVEVLPVSIDTGGGYIESVETYISMKKTDLITLGIEIGTVLIIDSVQKEVYNVVDDLSGMVKTYFRDSGSSSFAEDY